MPFYDAADEQRSGADYPHSTWTETFDVPAALLGSGGDSGSPRKIGAAHAVDAAAASSLHESPSCLANSGARGGECEEEEEGDGGSSATVAVETVGRWTYVPITLGPQPRQVGPGQWDSVYKGFAVPLMSVDPETAE